MSNGFIPVKRSLFDHFLFTEKRVYSRFEAWLDLIQMASFTDENKKIIAGKFIELDRGEVVASLRYLMNRWSWSMSKVCDYLELLRSQQMVVVTKESGVTKIRLVNFEKHNSLSERDSKKYNESRNQTGFDHNKDTSKRTQTRTSMEQPGDSEGANNKKDNNVNKENNSREPPAPETNPYGEIELCYDIEKMLLENKKLLHSLCAKHKKNEDTGLFVLKKYHLHLIENERYPRSKSSLTAGFEKWLMDEKSYRNAKSGTKQVGRDFISD